MKKSFIIVGTIIFTVLIIIVFVVFVFYFHSQPVSLNIAHWGAFGDYIGGIMNPILTIANIVVLGYLTYQISKHSVEENKKLFLSKKKIEAYEEFMDNLKTISIIISELRLLNVDLHEQNIEKSKVSLEESIESLHEIRNGLKKHLIELGKYREYLRMFKVKYDLLLKNSFSEFDYDLIQKPIDDVYNAHNDLYLKMYNFGLNKNIESVNIDFDSFTDNSVKFINLMRKELENEDSKIYK